MKIILSALLVLVANGAVGSVCAQPSAQEYSLEIARQPLKATLTELSKQTGLDVSYVKKNRKQADTMAGPLNGRYTVEAALSELLADSDLVFTRINDRTIAVTAPKTAKSARDGESGARMSKTSKQSAPKVLHFADRRPFDEARGDFRVRRTADVATAEEISRFRDVEIEEMIVTGSNIRGVRNSTAPVAVLDKAHIDSTGLSTTTHLIESLPQNFALANQAGVSVPGVTGSLTQGVSINLRAIGEDTTLVLLNGRRMALGSLGSAVDIASLPLSAIERVEVLTDGGSALYGSDAVGGVVNLILRRDFEGMETRLRSGWADGGVNEYRLSQLQGTSWTSGNGVLALEYYKRDLLRASERDFVPDTSVIGSLLPRDESYSALLAGQQVLTNTFSVFVDALYTDRDSYQEGGRTTYDESYTVDNPQVTTTVGAAWQVRGDWQIEMSGSYARSTLDHTYNNGLDIEAGRGAAAASDRFEIRTARVKADGSLFALPGGTVRVAAGADWRAESLQYTASYANGEIARDRDSDQIVRSAFGEVYVPIVGMANALAGAQRIELSLAGRFDDYSSFDSSFDPRIGVMWEPIDGLRFRGSYGTSYAAPRLGDYFLSGNSAVAYAAADPDSTNGVSRVLDVTGTDVRGLAAQESTSSSLGFAFTPASMRNFGLAASYYKIEYHGRIGVPPLASVLLRNPSSFGNLMIRNPSVAQVNEYAGIGQLGQGFYALDSDSNLDTHFDPSTVDVIVDRRRRNLSALKTSGLDVSMQYGFNAAASEIHLGLTGTYIFELGQQVISTSERFDSVDTFHNPPDWRARGSVSWRHHSWATNLFINHTDSYADNRGTTSLPVSSYTTVDARVAYDFAERFQDGFLSGITMSANVQNLFDKDPPRTAIVESFRDRGFDPTNASPIGRFVGVELLKKW